MTNGIADRLLNVAFKFAKGVSVFLAALLLIAFLVAIGLSVKKYTTSNELEQSSFDMVMNEAMQANVGKEQGGALAAHMVDVSNEVRAKYGKNLGEAMKQANCSAQFDDAMKQLALIAADEGTAAFLDEMANGAVKWFDDAAKYQKTVGNANAEWYCSEEGYWQSAQAKLEAAAATQAVRKLETWKGLGIALATLLAAFVLMVIPAIYRIEESVRSRVD